jgi:7-cyano-7-deazaguanine synthase
MSKAILLSGGIDSTALIYQNRFDIILAITVNYGQKPALSEISVSAMICKELNIKHEVLDIDCSSLGSGEMVGSSITTAFAPMPEWWPYRNQLIITLAAMKAIHYRIDTLIIGTVKSDKRFADGSRKFLKSFSKCLAMQEGNVKIEAPAINLTSAQLVIQSSVPDKLLLWAHSCHTSNNPCGICNGCVKYLKVMKSLGIN